MRCAGAIAGTARWFVAGCVEALYPPKGLLASAVSRACGSGEPPRPGSVKFSERYLLDAALPLCGEALERACGIGMPLVGWLPAAAIRAPPCCIAGFAAMGRALFRSGGGPARRPNRPDHTDGDSSC